MAAGLDRAVSAAETPWRRPGDLPVRPHPQAYSEAHAVCWQDRRQRHGESLYAAAAYPVNFDFFTLSAPA